MTIEQLEEIIDKIEKAYSIDKSKATIEMYRQGDGIHTDITVTTKDKESTVIRITKEYYD